MGPNLLRSATLSADNSYWYAVLLLFPSHGISWKGLRSVARSRNCIQLRTHAIKHIGSTQISLCQGLECNEDKARVAAIFAARTGSTTSKSGDDIYGRVSFNHLLNGAQGPSHCSERTHLRPLTP